MRPLVDSRPSHWPPVLLAACQGPVLDSGDRFTRTASADAAASAAPGGDRSDRTVSTDRAKRAIYGGLGNQR